MDGSLRAAALVHGHMGEWRDSAIAPTFDWRVGGAKLIGERRAVQAFLQARPLSRGPLEVELREAAQTSDPRSGRPVLVPPLVVLWIEERPVAVRVRTVVAISRFPPEPRLVSMLEADCLAAGLAVERIPEAGLWRLFAQPPRPRLARG
jgi:hypothetical protein